MNHLLHLLGGCATPFRDVYILVEFHTGSRNYIFYTDCAISQENLLTSFVNVPIASGTLDRFALSRRNHLKLAIDDIRDGKDA